MKSSIILISIVLLVSACAEESTNITKKYFDLGSVIQSQIKVLNEKKPSFIKTVWNENTPETKMVIIQDWAKELELFLQADLNKPAYLNSYEVIETDTLLNYRLKNTESLPVKSLTIRKVEGKLESIEAVVQNKNYLYESNKQIRLHLADGQMVSYFINGTQQLVFGDKKVFKIEAKVKK
jgi:hypothetical protein